MSCVTSVILKFDLGSDEDVATLMGLVNSAIVETTRGQSFKLIDQQATGGTHCFDCNIAMAGFNHVDTEDLLADLLTVNWGLHHGDSGGDVQLLVKTESNPAFNSYFLDTYDVDQKKGTIWAGEGKLKWVWTIPSLRDRS